MSLMGPSEGKSLEIDAVSQNKVNKKLKTMNFGGYPLRQSFKS